MSSPPSTPPPLRFVGGTAGALAPFVLFLAGVGWLGLSGAPDETGFWPVLLGALTLGLLLARDKDAYTEAVLGGMARPLVMLMVMAWLLAGVLGVLLRESGMVEALVWAAEAAGISGGGYVAGAFLVAAVFSTATGTSLGTLLVCTPLLYPAGVLLVADPGFLLGAILGGATFGDNVSPISDTTIASAGSQAADVGGVVRSRIRYALPAAGAALLAALLLGGAGDAAASAGSAGAVGTGGAGLAGGAAAGGAAGAVGVPLPGPGAWAMLAVPVAVLALLVRRTSLLAALMAGILLALGLGLGLGVYRLSDVLGVDHDNFIATGLILEGMRSAVGISVFTLLIMGLVGGLEAAGLVGRLVAWIRGRARGPRSAEAWLFAAVSGAVILTTHAVVAILAVGEVARETGRAFGVGRYRRANLLDVTVCTWPFLLPFFIPTILASALTGGVQDMPRLSPWDAGLHNVHSWGLLVVVLVAIATGWGRDDGVGRDDARSRGVPAGSGRPAARDAAAGAPP